MLYSYIREADGRVRQEWLIGADPGMAPLPEMTNGGSAWRSLVVPKDRALIDAREVRLKAGLYCEDEVRVRTAAGIRRMRLLGYPKRYRGGWHRIIGAAVDVTEAAPADTAGQRDPLTGLASYPAFQDALQAAIAECGPVGIGIALLFINLNAYNEIAQNFGVPAADEAAVAAAQRLIRIQSGPARLGRIHTDEFVCFMPGLTAAEVPHLVQSCEAALTPPLDVEGIQVALEPVIGAACFPADGDGPRHLVRRAAIAAAIAEERRKSWHLFEGQRDTVGRNLSLMQDLRRALQDHGQLTMAYQPQVDLCSGRMQAVEALLRWTHPVLGAVPPAQFLPQAEATRLIQDLFRWTLATALAQLAAWHAQGADLRLALNLSGRNLTDPGLADEVLAALDRFGLPGSALILEVTETALIENDGGVEQLAALRRRGLGVSLDDFGTGYSSLAYLQRLPVSELKIDRCFVDGLAGSEANRRLVALILNTAAMFDLHTVGEGVECAADAAVLRELGCRAAQGYHFGRPVPAAEVPLDRLA